MRTEGLFAKKVILIRHEVNETAFNEGGVVLLAKRKKTDRKRGIRKPRKSEADPAHLYGPKARYFYIQTQQLILRLQVQALVKLWQLPDVEFETVCRDVWAYHLLLLPEPVVAAPIVSKSGGEKLEVDDGAKDDEGFFSYIENAGEANRKAGNQSGPSVPNGSNKVEESDQSPSTSESSSESDETKDPSASKINRPLDPDPELAKLLREISDSETESNSSESESEGTQKRRERAIFGAKGIYGAPAANIAVLMVACWMLRIPVIYRDFIKLIESYELPYLETLRLLDKSWQKPLTSQMWGALSPSFPPTTARLHRLASRLARNMYRRYGIVVPQFNFPPVLWRAVREFHGNATLYTLSRTICATLELPFTLSRYLAPKITRVRRKDGLVFKGDNAPPELSVACAIIVALKMIYGLDNRGPRHPIDSEDPAAALPDIEDLLATLKASKEHQKNSRSAFLASNAERSVLDLNITEIDDYLDFAETALLRSDGTAWKDPNEKRKLSNYGIILERYQLQEREDDPRHLAWDETQPPPPERLRKNTIIPRSDDHPSPPRRRMSITSTRSTPESRTPSPGSKAPLLPAAQYTVYNSHDILGSLPYDYEVILEVASKWVGVGKEDVAALVDTYERRLLKWDTAIRVQSKKSRSKSRDSNGDEESNVSDGETTERRGRPGKRSREGSVARKSGAKPRRMKSSDEDYDAAMEE
ncbi:hypothetical protein FRB90_009127 [Tulasnella sp. 427]|nr:hypothetical protein FRB90_009127 [Tulasnella sp. 427]